MNAADLEQQGPQLAAPSKDVAAGPPEVALAALMKRNRYSFELKFDGVRCFAFLNDGEVKLINRRGADTTHRYPELVARFMELYPTGQYVFDGEIVVWGADGKPDFSAIHRRDAQSNGRSAAALMTQFPASFVAFDVLLIMGTDVRGYPQMDRASWLKSEADAHWQTQRVMVGLSTDNGTALWAHVKAQGLEGLIAKDKHAAYRAGRNPTWVKLKIVFTVSVVIVGYTPGKGRRANGIGALSMAMVGPNGPVECGEVGTGLTDRDLDDLKLRIDRGELLVAEVECGNITSDTGKLRFPSYKGLRTDMVPTDCTADQLDALPRY